MRAQFVDLFQQNGNKKDMCPFIFSRDKGENHTSVLMSKFRKNRVYNIIFIVAGFAVHISRYFLRGHSPTTWTKFYPILTASPPRVELWTFYMIPTPCHITESAVMPVDEKVWGSQY